MKIAIINGPNLNLVGTREPAVYGSRTFEDLLAQLKERHPLVKFDYFQGNGEGEVIDALHKAAQADGIVLNAGAYTHTSVAIADAVAAIEAPVVEVHLSNIFSREDFRHVSFCGAKCAGTISGLGMDGYVLAVDYLLQTKKPLS